MCYSSAFCWGVLSAVSTCRTPFLKNFYKLIPLRCTPSNGTKSHNGLWLELSSVACSFHTCDTKIRFSTYCLWSNHQPVFSWTTFAGFVFQGGHIFVHSFIGLFMISLTVQIVQPCPLEVAVMFESKISHPVSLGFATFHTLNGFYDRHLLNSWIWLLLALLPIDVNSNTTVVLPLSIPALPNMTSRICFRL